ncbi:hypothetical protein [Plantactinospora sp. KBS50]|uniref:hypothetical protein n=1 Tax=Plantactinospora sp. KBS50 TaxID=2024580 RepID=UPI000BAAAA8B|nr:hypothetical protein [Plantactinospora sp. KBS50]ASW57207.1 hypothetical protein CIK06_28315 [Plantactinospora sp. KBS50]
MVSFVLLAGWVTARLWVFPDQELRANRSDQALFEWMLAHGARVLTTGADPLFSDRMNAPVGVNLMANTSVLTITLPLTPGTLALGPHLAFTVFLTGALAGTGIAWYLLFSRMLVRTRSAAWLGALVAGFAPGMVSHANGHPNIVAQFLVPVLVWRTVRLRDPGRWLRNGALLAAVAVAQAFLNPEILLFTAVGLGIVTAVVAALRPAVRRDARTFLAGLGTAALLSGLLLAYPLSVALTGPGSYRGLPPAVAGYAADLLSFGAYSRESLGGHLFPPGGLAQNATEENAFFGWPLLLALPVLVWWLRRSAVALAVSAAALVFALLSLGPRLRVAGRITGIPGPWAALDQLPVLDAVVPTRWALAAGPLLAVLVALGWDRAMVLARDGAGAAGPVAATGPDGAGGTHEAQRTHETGSPDGAGRDVAGRDVAGRTDETGRRDGAGSADETGSPGGWWTGRRVRLAMLAALVLLLLPLAPTPLPTAPLDPVPAFVTAGTWREYVVGDRTVVPLPLPDAHYTDPLRWSAVTGLDLRLPRGYFLGPDGRPDRRARFSAPPRSTSNLFSRIRDTGSAPPITARRRQAAVADLRYWRAGVVVLAPVPYEAAMRRAMTELTGIEPVRRGGVWVWDVRALTA